LIVADAMHFAMLDTSLLFLAFPSRSPENVRLSPRQQFWVRVVAVAGAACMLIAAGVLYRNWSEATSSMRYLLKGPGTPVYQWVESDARAFDVLPGEGKGWGPVAPQQGEIRYAVVAAMPVDVGLMDEAQWSNRMDGWLGMRSLSTCFEGRIRKTVRVCRMQSGRPQLIFVRDLRAKQAGIGFEHLFGTKGALEEPNTVTITILALRCLENCRYALK
jgi:hypothetical protein